MKNKRWLNHLYGARSRCTNPNASGYKHYGNRGIKCFLTNVEIENLWIRDNAEALKEPSIDRINSDGNYSFDNCRFIERKLNLPRLADPLNPKRNFVFIRAEKEQKESIVKTAKLNNRSISDYLLNLHRANMEISCPKCGRFK